MRQHYRLILLAMLVEIAATLPRCFAASQVGGPISKNTTWTAAGSPYVVVMHTEVTRGVTLTIKPGVVVTFKGPYYLKISGTLIARGTKRNPITFTSDKKEPGSWIGILFESGSESARFNESGEYIGGSILEHCRIEYGGMNFEIKNGAIRCNGAGPFISYCSITNNKQGISITDCKHQKIIITNSVISKNKEGGVIGCVIYAYNSIEVVIKNCKINNNDAKNGYIIYADRGLNGQFRITIESNEINGNSGCAMYILYEEETSVITINSNTIKGNSKIGMILQGGHGFAIPSANRNVSVRYNEIAMNGSHGIFLRAFVGKRLKVQNCNIYNNKGYGIYNNCLHDRRMGGYDVQASNNWWGTTDELAIRQLVYDYWDDPNKGKVIVKPFLTSPESKAGPAQYAKTFSAIAASDSVINNIESAGVNIAEARALLQQAKAALNKGQYSAAINLASQAKRKAEEARDNYFKNPPIVRMTVSVETEKIAPTLEASETYPLVLSVVNDGEGIAWDVKLTAKVEPTLFTKHITVNAPAPIPRLAPGDTTNLTIPVKAGLGVPDGDILLTIRGAERNGFDPAPAHVRLRTRALRRPSLHLARLTVIDDGTGYSNGNGDGIIQNGETIELRGELENRGVGQAKGIRILVNTGGNVRITHQPKPVGDIPVGSAVSLQLALAIPPNFPGGAIPLNFRFFDSRGLTFSQERALDCFHIEPRLTLSYDLYKEGMAQPLTQNVVQKGERYELVAHVWNQGKLDAQSVKVSLSNIPEGVNITGADYSLGRVPAGDRGKAPFGIFISGNYQGNTLGLKIQVGQSNFPGQTLSVSIPVKELQLPPVFPKPIPPPIVRIISPAEDTVAQSTVEVIVTARSDENPVEWIKLYVNGEEVYPARALSIRARREFVVTLRDGRNVLKAVAWNGTEARAIRVLQCELAFDPFRVYQKSHALIIGIDDYAHVHDLGYAVADANAVADLLKKRYGFEHPAILRNSEATKARIEKELVKLTDSKIVAQNDRVIVFFAGHGQTVRTRLKGDTGFLIPYDANVDFRDLENAAPYMQTCIPMRDLRKYALMMPARHVLFLLDCCFSGLALERKLRIPAKTPDLKTIKLYAYQPAVQVITAGGKNQRVPEIPEIGHGAFTAKLLDGLRGAADWDGDSIILASELATYVRNELKDFELTPWDGEFFATRGQFMFIKSK